MRERRRVAAAEVEGLVRALRPSKALREDVRSTVADIVDMVRDRGDEAVGRLTSRLDGVDVERLRVAPSRLREALDDLAPDVREALELLAENLRLVAEDKMPRPTQVTLRHGQVVSTRQVPVRRVGVYVPGGLAAYPSSAVMAIVPAQVDGVPTTHYSFDIQLSSYGKLLSPQTLKTVQGMINGPVTVGYWIDEGNLPRKITSVMKVNGKVISTVVTYSDWGRPVTIVAPPASQVGKMPVG